MVSNHMVFSIWLCSSLVCTVSSKLFLQEMPTPFFFSFLQSSLCAMLISIFFRTRTTTTNFPTACISIKNDRAAATWKLGIVCSIGYACINACYSFMPITTALFLRIFEVLFTTIMSCPPTDDNTVEPKSTCLCIMLVLACTLLCDRYQQITWLGIVLSILSNMLFSLRSVFARDFFRNHDLDTKSLLYDIYRISAIIHFIFFVVFEGGVLYLNSHVYSGFFLYKLAILMCFNGTCFFIANFSSLFVLSRFPILTHAVGNSIRRVFIILLLKVYLGFVPNATNFLGVICAILSLFIFSTFNFTKAQEHLPGASLGPDSKLDSAYRLVDDTTPLTADTATTSSPSYGETLPTEVGTFEFIHETETV